MAKLGRRSERLTDSYVRAKLCRNSELRAADIPDDLVALKRVQLASIRAVRDLKKTLNQLEN